MSLGCGKNIIQHEPTVRQPISITTDSTSRTDSAAHNILPTDLFRPGNAIYDYRTVSVVRVTLGDTVPRVDTSTVSALLSATFQTSGSDNLTTQVRITVDSITVQTRSSPILHFTPYTDTLRITTATGKVTLVGSQNALCEIQAHDALVRSDDVVPVLSGKRAAIWGDTSVRQVCRAGIQLEAHRVVTYQLDSTATDPRLLRSTVTTFNGQGTQWNQPVESVGQSISTDTLFLDLTSRQRIERVRGFTRLQLSFKSQLRNQQFEQLTELFIQLR